MTLIPFEEIGDDDNAFPDALDAAIAREIAQVIAEHEALTRGLCDSPLPEDVPDFRDPYWRQQSDTLQVTLRNIAFERIASRRNQESENDSPMISMAGYHK